MSTRAAVNLYGSQVTAEDILCLINHIILPPQLPQTADEKPQVIEQNLLHLIQHVLSDMDRGACAAWEDVVTMLTKLDDVKTLHHLDSVKLSHQLSTLSPGDSIALYLDAQNAGLLIRHSEEERIVFETFELSTTSESVMSTSGRLSRTFPGRAVNVPAKTFFDSKFRKELSTMLSQFNEESIELYQPTSKKAGSDQKEVRETTHPGLLFECLMPMLCALGDNEDTNVVQKFIRDDVLWNSSFRPWRRAPFWLFLKVSIIRTLMASVGPTEGRKQYKLFLIEVIARLLHLCSSLAIMPDLLSTVHVKLARRIHKLEQEFGPTTLQHILDVSQKVRKSLNATWEAEIANEKTVSKIPITGWEDATCLLLPTARKVVHEAVKPLPTSEARPDFVPQSQPRARADRLPSLQSLTLGNTPVVVLAEIESWVEQHLTAWTDYALGDLEFQSCDDLAILIDDYWSLAKVQYEWSPVEKSNALLTMVELWVALDKLAISRIPLLQRHSPEISTTLFAPLLLPKLGQMRRLAKVERYIDERLAHASPGATSVFAQPTANSIHIWYFDITPKLQELRHKIDQHDHAKRQQRLEELRIATQRARLGDRTYQAIPKETFAEQLPLHFSTSFTHWLDEATGEVEFRPRESMWQCSPDQWRLSFSSANFLQARTQMRRGTKRLIDDRSSVGKSTTTILDALDSASHCEITLDDKESSELRVYLRRYNLHFKVTAGGSLLSLEYKSIVDHNQSIDTMIGLRSKLVLREASSSNGPQERRVIIPWGKVDIAKKEKHVTIGVHRGGGRKQRYFVYTLDRHLRKLRGQQDVLGTLYRAYLHAVTSSVLPDPLTGRTGTEESISTLKEASLFSCSPLDEDELSTLNLVAALTPHRVYYPVHLKVMQKVGWNSFLSPVVQHDDFLLAATSIFDHHAANHSLFGSDIASKMTLGSRGDSLLLRRARSRNASVTKSGLFCDLPLIRSYDVPYPGRDNMQDSSRASRVFEIASLIREWPSRIAAHHSLTAVVKTWGLVSGYHTGLFDVSSLKALSTLEVNAHFGSLYELCRNASRSSATFSLMFKFSVIAIGGKDETLSRIRTLLAFAFTEKFLNIDPPPMERSYDLSQGSSPTEVEVLQIVGSHLKDYELPENPDSNQIAEYTKREEEQTEQIKILGAHIVSQWPGAMVRVAQHEFMHIETARVVVDCQNLFNKWHKNRRFLEHIRVVDNELASMQTHRVQYQMSPPKFLKSNNRREIKQPLNLPELLEVRPSMMQGKEGSKATKISLQPMKTIEDAFQVREIVDFLSSKPDSTHRAYSESLRASVEAFEGKFFDLESESAPLKLGLLVKYQRTMTEQVEIALQSISSSLSPSSLSQTVLEHADLWPRLSQSDLLSQLSKDHVSRLSEHWKASLLQLAEKIALMQRAERLVRLHGCSNHRGLWKELKHCGREGWSAKDYPSWLLLEIENNITIRPLQAKVALEMISPSSGRNSVLQLNMGEGKSSVIVPMLAAALADGKRMVRVIVLKPLLRQTEQVLTQRLGGLLNQRVGHIPFSRKTSIDSAKVAVIRNTFSDFAQSSGVLVTLPEEILSMRLMTREKMVSKPSLAAAVLEMHRWLENTARDILDESDEILSVRSQLIYPVGSQQMLDGKNDRWQIAQAVLQRVNFHVKNLAESYPSELELDFSGRSFPLLKFLRSSVGDRLVELLVEDAVGSRIAGLSFDFYSEDITDAVRTYISSREVSKQDLTILAPLRDGPHWNAILILRGLFAHEVLPFALQRKRWLVEYGLDSRRCLMAVPYRAKGVPSTNSEFGHPDVAILLTCLSYYYTGLTSEQMYTCFTLLSKDSNPQDVYDGWVSAQTDFPQSLKSYEAVNLDDKVICERKLFPLIQYNLGTISFYLNQVVFPKEGKEFEKRISASGWDIPSSSSDVHLLTTGFSGTNDSRAVLPFAIKQEDLAELHHTNAMVLNLVLREENNIYLQSVGSDGRKLDVEGLLELINRQVPRINVLIDVGAQVLEATNFELVKQWLAFDQSAQAAVFFDEQDEAMVIDRSGSIAPLRISPFSGQLEVCLIYLDEVHTRGIDLAIPMGSRAAVTLGPRLVKDRLMQACMRLRSLGNGHSLCFIAPPEVHRNICDTVKSNNLANPSSFDVLAWSMEQTCQSLDIARPLRAMHGLEMLRQKKVLNQYLPASSTSATITSDPDLMEEFWQCIQEDDAQTLENLYGVNDYRVGVFQNLLQRNSDDETMQHLVEEFEAMSKTLMEDSSMDNEQERELEHEIEEERQVQRPPRVKPLEPAISKGLKQYIRLGTMFALGQCDTENAFDIFLKTTAKEAAVNQYINSEDFAVLATKDFVYCVASEKDSRLDDYLRPAVWVLSSPRTKSLLLISSHEANELLPQIKLSSRVRLHTFAARLSKKMSRFNNMAYYTPNHQPNDVAPPDEAVRDLDLFAGSLYLDNIFKYQRLCRFLGIVTSSTRPRNRPIHTDGFLDTEIRDEMKWPVHCPFERSPLPFFKHVISLRMHGQAFSHSHMGALFYGRTLQDAAFEGCQEIEEILKEMEIDG